MNFADLSVDLLLLAFYIVSTLILIALGKLCGDTAYEWYYRKAYPTAYKNRVGRTICGTNGVCRDMNAEEIYTAALDLAREDGRWIGAWIGFMIGGTLSLIAAYNIYVKLRTPAA